MPTLEEIFELHTAKSAGFESYTNGTVAFVTNGLKENGIIGFVEPLTGDKVFTFLGIALSAFCEATVQLPPFVARGNGGSGLIVLEPKRTMSLTQLSYVAAYINTTLRWRFSWYRQASVERVRQLEVPDPETTLIQFHVKKLLPTTSRTKQINWPRNFQPIPLDSLYDLKAGNYHNITDLPPGEIPIVSCGDANNGISGFVRVPEDRVYHHKLTIAFNGMNTLTAKYHPYQFAAKDDVAICFPRTPLQLSTELFIQIMLNRERWRYSYYRKCFMEKLKRFAVFLPTKQGQINEDGMRTIMETTPYCTFLKNRLTPSANSPLP
jgi:hypothetical protein